MILHGPHILCTYAYNTYIYLSESKVSILHACLNVYKMYETVYIHEAITGIGNVVGEYTPLFSFQKKKKTYSRDSYKMYFESCTCMLHALSECTRKRYAENAGRIISYSFQ